MTYLKYLMARGCLLCLAAACAAQEAEYALKRDPNTMMSRTDAERAHANTPPMAVPPGIDTPARVISSRFPPYPRRLINAGVTGSVHVYFYIEADGTVSDPVVKGSPPPELAAASLEAIRQWTFAPASKDGKPVRIQVLQTFDFRVD